MIGDAGRRIGRGVRRIKLYAGEHAVAKAALDVIGIAVVGEIAGDQRLEGRSRRQRRHHALAIGDAVPRGAHGRDEVRHQNGAAEVFRRVRQHRLEHFAVANVQVPVVRLANGDPRGHCTLSRGPSPLTPSLSPTGRGGAASPALKNSDAQESEQQKYKDASRNLLPLPSGERDGVRGLWTRRINPTHPIGAAAAAKVSIGGSSIIAPVRSATRAKPRLAHHSSRPSMIAIMPVGLRKVR